MYIYGVPVLHTCSMLVFVYGMVDLLNFPSAGWRHEIASVSLAGDSARLCASCSRLWWASRGLAHIFSPVSDYMHVTVSA